MPLGAEKAQGTHVAVKDVDGLQTALETVQLLRRDAPVLLLVQARPVPEDEHLPVTNVELLPMWVVISKVQGHVQVGQELGNVGEEPVLRVGVLRTGPAIGEHDDERAVLRDAPRVHGLAWELVARGQHEGGSVAHLLPLLLQPRAPQETHGRLLATQHAQPGELLKIVERLLVLRPRVGLLRVSGESVAVTVTALTQDASNTSGEGRGVKHLVLAVVRH